MTSKKIGDFLKNIIVLIIRMIVTNPKSINDHTSYNNHEKYITGLNIEIWIIMGKITKLVK